jgi:hypothetical protein
MEIMESRVKNYFDQKNTKKELKDFSDSILNYQNLKNKDSASKEYLNSSHVSNVFEKSPDKSKDDYYNCKGEFKGKVTKDCFKKKVL